MSAGITVEERIVQDVLATLQGITAGAQYNTSIRYVRRQESNPNTVQAFPAAFVVHNGNAGSGEDGEGGFNALVTRKLKLLVYGVTNAIQDPTWSSQLDMLASDIENALRVDTQRGTSGGQPNAHFTAIADRTIYDQTEMGGAGVAAVELPVLVTFRHLLSDTTTPI